MSTLDNLKKEAKRWLKALRANDPEARERFIRAYPNAPEKPVLRDVQHALARKHGYESWTALRQAQDKLPEEASAPDTGGRTHAERVATFLEFACWDHHVHGKGDHRMYDHAAQRLLTQHPEIARDSFYTAIVCGDLEEVERILAERPDAALEPGGPRGWTPLLYLCYTRFSHQATIRNAVSIARALLDRGANPNDFYMAGDASYTALVGVAGEGEQDSPRQPQGEDLFQLLLERGAEPFDIQVLYNTHFSGDVLWWLKLIHAHTMKTGRGTAWDDPDWPMLDMGGYGSGARFLLRIAVDKNDLQLAEWLLAHGANPNSGPARDARLSKRSLYEDALIQGFTDMAELLVRCGAKKTTPVLEDEEAFIAACLRLDHEEALAHIEKHPEYLKSHLAMFAAAKRDRADAVEFLLDLGVPIEVHDITDARTLHQAAANNALRVASLLIDRGAEIDPRETCWGATPIGWASHGDRVEMIDFLSRFSRNVWTLAFRGYVERLREVLASEPELATAVTNDGITPLWWLPDDEAKALEIVELLLTHGADPSLRSKGGSTAAGWARKRGMAEVARKLTVEGIAEVTTQPEPAPAPPPDLEQYNTLARHLLVAYETGHADVMQRLYERFGGTVTWEQLRSIVQQRLGAVPDSERIKDGMYEGYFGLAQARLLVARGAGFDNWALLVNSLAGDDSQ